MTGQTVRTPRHIKVLCISALMIVSGLAVYFARAMWLGPKQQVVTGANGIPTPTTVDPYHWVGTLGCYVALAGAVLGFITLLVVLVGRLNRR